MNNSKNYERYTVSELNLERKKIVKDAFNGLKF